MRGSLQCRDVAEVLEQEGFSPLPEGAREHLSSCAACHNLVADFDSILSAAHQLPAEVEPPARLWVSLRAQLAAEGLIKEASIVAQPAPRVMWWHGFAGLFQGRALATAAVGLLIFAAGLVQLRKATVPANVQPPPSASALVPETDTLTASGTELTNQERQLHIASPAGTLATSPVDPVDDSLQKNLQTLNAFIVECQHHLKANPHDQLAREYLAAALQQKAELLAEMLDRGRSVN